MLHEGEHFFTKGFGERNRLFEKEACQVFETFYAEAKEPDEMIHVTCTGYVAPSPGQRLIASHGWKTKLLHLYHMGCFGSVPAIRIAQAMQGCVDVVHTEICSLHFNHKAHDAEQIVAQSLFADGFIKYSVSEQPTGFRILQIEEQLLPDTADQMTWNCEDWGLKMTLSRQVPQHFQSAVEPFVMRFGRVDYFALHPGGPKIIDQIQRQLQLCDDQVAHSRKILQQYGNMSSATLPHILEEMVGDLSPGDRVLGLAFGPGLMMVGLLLETV